MTTTEPTITLSNIAALALIVIALGCPVFAYVAVCRRHIRRLAPRLLVYLLGLAPALYLAGDSIYWHRQEDKLVAAIMALPPGSSEKQTGRAINHLCWKSNKLRSLVLWIRKLGNMNNPNVLYVDEYPTGKFSLGTGGGTTTTWPVRPPRTRALLYFHGKRIMPSSTLWSERAYGYYELIYTDKKGLVRIATPSARYRPNDDGTGWVKEPPKR